MCGPIESPNIASMIVGCRRSALVCTPPPAGSGVQHSDVSEQFVDRTGLDTVRDVCGEVDQLDAVSEPVTGMLDMIDGKHTVLFQL